MSKGHVVRDRPRLYSALKTLPLVCIFFSPVRYNVAQYFIMCLKTTYIMQNNEIFAKIFNYTC